MPLKSHEKFSYLWAPWIFALVLTIFGIIVNSSNPAGLHGVLLICSGLICMSLFSVCSLLVKSLEIAKGQQ